MNYSTLPREELEAILLSPRSRPRTRRPGPQADHGTLEDRDRHLQRALRAAHELLTRIAEQRIRGRCLLSSPDEVREYLHVLFAGAERESFVVIYLDNQHRAIEVERPFTGTVREVNVHPREIARRALQLNAAAVICCHPHLGLDATPSGDDIRLTRLLKAALELIDVRLMDHLIVAGASLVSCADEGPG